MSFLYFGLVYTHSKIRALVSQQNHKSKVNMQVFCSGDNILFNFLHTKYSFSSIRRVSVCGSTLFSVVEWLYDKLMKTQNHLDLWKDFTPAV